MSTDVYQCRECGEEFTNAARHPGGGCPLCGSDDAQVIDVEVVAEPETEEEIAP